MANPLAGLTRFAHLSRAAKPAGKAPAPAAGEPEEKTESEEDMRARHARELRECGYADDDDASADDDGGGDGDGGDSDAKKGDELPDDDSPDPDDDPPEDKPDGDGEDDPDDDKEDDEDEEAGKKATKPARAAARGKLRAKRRAAARRAERRRCAAIFAAKAAASNPALAAELAFGTNLKPARAIKVLERGAAAASGLGARMAGLASHIGAVGPGGSAPGAVPEKAVAASWDKAMTKARNW